MENLGAFSSSSSNLLSELGCRISVQTGHVRSSSFLFQHISVAIQRFKTRAFAHDTQWRNNGVAAASSDGGPTGGRGPRQF